MLVKKGNFAKDVIQAILCVTAMHIHVINKLHVSEFVSEIRKVTPNVRRS